MFFIYVIKSLKDGQFYVGMSANPQKRLSEHNAGMQKSTQGHRPYRLVFTEEFPSRIEARKREKFLKSGIGREYIRKILPPTVISS